MSECRRNFTKEQIIAGLKAGRTFMVDRRDAPELDDLFDLEREGLVTQEFVVTGSQSSAIRWRWKTPQPAQTPVSREPSSSPAPASAGGRQ